MDEALIAALLQCRAAEALVKLESMRSENLARVVRGEAPAYGEAHFLKIIEESGIHHNAVYGLIQENQ